MSPPALLCIDVEPNDREVAGDPDGDWSATEPCVEVLEGFRARLQASSGQPVHFNWFLRLDPQVADTYGRADYVYQRYRPLWERARAAGDSLGIHVHAWRKHGAQWVADHGDLPWVLQCVQESLDAFARCTGGSATTFRFGDHFLSNSVIKMLEARGVRYEMTIEPGVKAMPMMQQGEHATGHLPDYTHVPRTAYFPSRFDYRRAGWLFPRRLRMVPASTGCIGPEVLPADNQGIFIHLNLGVDAAMSQRVCNGVLASPRTRHLCWVSRTGDYADAKKAADFRANLDYLAGLGLRFHRPDELWP